VYQAYNPKSTREASNSHRDESGKLIHLTLKMADAVKNNKTKKPENIIATSLAKSFN
jgi:hypothetical protein